MNVIKKSLFPDSIFDNLEKKDGLIAIAYFVCFLAIEFLLLYLVKCSPLYQLLDNNIDKNYFYHLVFVLILDFPSLILLFIILKKRKQSIYTIGLKKVGLKSSLIIGSTLIFSILGYYLYTKGLDFKLINSTLFYILGIGFYEELIFRGFLWPRLVKGFGRTAGTITSGLFFGLAHIPIDIVFKNKSIVDILVFGNASNTNILGGIAGALMFIYIYTRNENILLPSFIHGALDFMKAY